MMISPEMMTLVALLACAACSRSDMPNRQAPAETADRTDAAGNQPSAAARADNASAGSETAGSILAWSRPASGSTVVAPVNELVFHFSPPARLSEVTVTGPEGAMPMMVTAIGEVEHYSLPLSATEPGSYSVNWRASAAGKEHQGSFGFTVRG